MDRIVFYLGLGLMGPGAGFLAHADLSTMQGMLHLSVAAFGFFAFMFALLIWFVTGNVLAPPLIWLCFALSASAMNHGPFNPEIPRIILAAITFLTFIASAFCFLNEILQRNIRERKNNYLVKFGSTVSAEFLQDDNKSELSYDELKRMEFLLDRALQPLPEFNGFEWLDQFQTAAVRYQVNFLGYALSMAQATYLPALGGYLHQAQKNLILKQTDYRVWRYWTIENLWGNLRYNPDPVARENIMYTGFCALQMAMYQKASGKKDFERPGSFLLKTPNGQQYAYDMTVLIDALGREAKKSKFHLIACEPNWIYPLCNLIGASAVCAQNQAMWETQKDNFRLRFENEFMNLRGNIIPCRSRYTGFAIPDIGGMMPQTLPCLFLNATFPDIAMRQWLVLRSQMLKNGRLSKKKFWPIDTGNYGFSRASAYAVTALDAAELGDGEIKNMCF